MHIVNDHRFHVAGALIVLACIAAGPPQPRTPGAPRDTAGIGGRPERRAVDLSPTTRPTGALTAAIRKQPRLELGPWSYWVERTQQPRDGVPWILHAAPIGAEAERWRPSGEFLLKQRIEAIPVVRIPEQLWKGWLPPTMADVVGIHYHEFVTADLARLLITAHRVPPEGDDDAQSPIATRLEATLLTPLSYSLDQAILIRANPKEPTAAQARAAHEQGHAGESLQALLTALAGPETWNVAMSSGRRATLVWYWRAERWPRAWEEYREGRFDLATLRTTLALVPPTRWSKLLPKPPQEVTDADLQQFNDEVVQLSDPFRVIDQHRQDAFHAGHGAYEGAASR